MYTTGIRKTWLRERFYRNLILSAVSLLLAGYFWYQPVQSRSSAIWELLPYSLLLFSIPVAWLAFRAKYFFEQYRETFIQEVSDGLQVAGFHVRWDEIESYEYVPKDSFRKKKFGHSVYYRRRSEEVTNKMLFLHLKKEAAQRYKAYPELRRMIRSWEGAGAIQVNSYIFESDDAFVRFVALVDAKVKAHPNSWKLDTK
jgi:hypothetical protein